MDPSVLLANLVPDVLYQPWPDRLLVVFGAGLLVFWLVWRLVASWRRRRQRAPDPQLSLAQLAGRRSGQLGLPAPDLIGQRYIQRFIICSRYVVKSDRDDENMDGFYTSIWDGPRGGGEGLRYLIDRFHDVDTPPRQDRLHFQAVPYEHILVLYEQQQGWKDLLDDLRRQYVRDLDPLVDCRTLPRIRGYHALIGTDVLVFFGAGVFVPEIEDRPRGAVYIETRASESAPPEKYPIVYGSADDGPNTTATRAGLYHRQRSVVFSDLPISPATVSERIRMERPALYVIGSESAESGPGLYWMDISEEAKGYREFLLSNDIDDAPKSDYWSVVDPTKLQHHYRALVFDGYRYAADIRDLVDAPTKGRFSKVEIVLVPDTAYTRLRKGQAGLAAIEEVPHFAVLAILVPNPMRPSQRVRECTLFRDRGGWPVGDSIEEVASAVCLRRDGEVVQFSGEGRKSLHRYYRRKEYRARADAVTFRPIQQAAEIGDWRNSPGNNPKSSAEAAQRVERNILNGFVAVTTLTDSPLGYVASQVYPGQNGAEWYSKSPVKYLRAQGESDRDEPDTVLDWLDAAVEIEAEDEFGTVRLGYARWFNEHLLRPDFPLYERQTWEDQNGGLVLVEDGVDDSRGVAISDGDRLRLGPLLLRYHAARGQG